MIQIDNYAYNSKLLWNAPGAKIAFGAVPLIITLYMDNIFTAIFTILVMGYFSIRYSGVSIKNYIKLMKIPLSFIILGTITIVFTSGIKSEMLIGVEFFGSIYGITSKSLTMGIALILKALSAISCMYFVSLNTVMTEIISFLNKIKMPSIIISLMELIYRYIFIILEEADQMKIAGDSRLGYIDFKTSIKTTGELIAGLFIRTYMKADKIYEALLSRGYENTFHRVSVKYKSSTRLYLTMIIIAIIQITIGVVA